MKMKLNHLFTRDLTLTTCQLWNKWFSEAFCNELGVAVKQLLYFNGRAVETYRLQHQLDEVSTAICNKNDNDDLFSKARADKFLQDIDFIWDKINNPPENSKEFLLYFDELYKKIFEVWTIFVIVVLLPTIWRDKFITAKPKTAEKILKDFWPLRIKSEGFLEQLDVIYREKCAELLAKNNLDRKYARLIKIDEFKDLLASRYHLNVDQLDKRLKGYIFYQDKIYVDISLEDFFAKNNFYCDRPEIDKYAQEIKGQVACQGNSVSSKAQIILNGDEAKNFVSGNILVTTMTSPEYIPAMKKSMAIVTDEGGITCHAAIVSRELNIPCIIGTKVATKILKDGDRIEVDTSKGIVRILK